MPAHGGSAADAVQERLARSWSEDFGLAVLLVDFEPHGFMNLELGAPSRLSGQGRLDRRGGRGPDARRTDWREWKPMLEQARRSYEMVCADLTHATPEVAKKVLGLANSIFLVSDSDSASVETTRDKIRQMRTLGMEDRCALLLRRAPGGLRPDLAEDLAETPVCGLVDAEEQIALLARLAGSGKCSAESRSRSCLIGEGPFAQGARAYSLEESLRPNSSARMIASARSFMGRRNRRLSLRMRR